MFYGELFFDYLKQYLKTKLAYRLDLLNELISDFISQIVNLVFILVVFQHTNFIKGWSQQEIIFIYGFFLIPFAVFSTFFNFWEFQEKYIIKGEMDRILTRPAHHLFQVVLETMDPESLAGVFTGLIIMGYAGYQLDLEIAWYDPFVFVLLVLSGVFLYGGVYIAIASLGFFIDAKTGISPMIYNIQSYGRYPVDIYNKVIRFVLTWILPFAFVGVYPSAYFLGREDLFVYVWITPVMGIVFFVIGVWLWNLGVKNYRGAGS
ncbi:ABC transporter permease [Ammoniphilus resinae]|uniref:ABC-2 type transport system permease protein n=1 Tax=Ammoniphilus resinae TaxID=861532 RepID=A0ABS4GJ17_9BACL|nr:ABC-2 family transporter protein [Ammoniphilus resinae]MBP1930257.1 ABC-2 type transport system permease protein [Ammoniphilus resinae]